MSNNSFMNEEVFLVNGYELDSEQKEIVLSNDKNILVIAGAGSGKSFTITGKLKYLMEMKGVKGRDIICVSFTNDSCESLRKSISKNCKEDVEVLTFHKLSLKILSEHNVRVSIAYADLLEYLIDEFFESLIYQDEFYIRVVLKYFKVKYFGSVFKAYESVLVNKKHEVKVLKEMISTFIHLFKSGGYEYSYLYEIYCNERKKVFVNKKNLCFLTIVVKVFYEYDLEMSSSGCIDFDDMILKATKVLKCSNKKLNYKYVIIDEFQDTSMVRYKLIREILNKSGANFMAVGDDYQSIYRFTGCELSLFLNFKSLFNDGVIYKIQTTYRNSIELIKVCEKFIKKNKLQLDKNLRSNISLDKPVKVFYYKNEKSDFLLLLDYIYKMGHRKVLILGRNNNDIYKVINGDFVFDKKVLVYRKYTDLSMEYLSVHRSKGLEESVVIVLSLLDDIWGFPNKKSDENILKYVLPKVEEYPFSEERRLFYVALSRTKSYVYLFVDKSKPSIFVNEIIKDMKKNIEVIN